MDETYVDAIPHGNGKYIQPASFTFWPDGSVTILVRYRNAVETLNLSAPQAMFFRAFYDRAIEDRTQKRGKLTSEAKDS